MRILTSAWVVPVSTPPIEHGAVVIEGDEIVAVGAAETLLASHGERAERDGRAAQALAASGGGGREDHETRSAQGAPHARDHPSASIRRRAQPGVRGACGIFDLGDAVLLPAFVNAHTHLELSWMAAAHRPRGDLLAWVRTMIARKTPPAAQVEAAVARALASLSACGTALVGDVGNTTASLAPLARSGLAGCFFLELIGARSQDPGSVAEALENAERLLREANPGETDPGETVPGEHRPGEPGSGSDGGELEQRRAEKHTGLLMGCAVEPLSSASAGGSASSAPRSEARSADHAVRLSPASPPPRSGELRRLDPAMSLDPAEPPRYAQAPSVSIVPHAPHTVSPEFLRALGDRARRRGDVLSVHVAESRAEVDLLLRGEGPFRALMEEVGAIAAGWQPPGRSPVQLLEEAGLLGPRTLAVHGVHLTREEARLLAARSSTLVLCPRSNEWIGVGEAPVALLLAEGVRLALGTDSLASNQDLDIFAELAALRRLCPAAPPEAILRAATLGGAEGLMLADRFGSLEAGKRAALVTLRRRQPQARARLPGSSSSSDASLNARAAGLSPALASEREPYATIFAGPELVSVTPV